MESFAYNFVNNFAAGVIASIVTVLLLEIIRKWRLRRTFKPLDGMYMHVDLDDTPLLDGTTEVRYLGRNLLSLRGRRGVGEWTGVLRMDETVPGFGTGTYEYAERPDCGVLQVHVSARDRSIFVHGLNTSHGKERVFAYRWRRLPART